MSIALCLYILVSVFVTAMISGALGLAGGMILMGLLAWQMDIPQAMMIHAVAMFFSNTARAAIHRHHIYFPPMAAYFAGLLLLVALFATTGFVTDKRLVFTIMGVSPFIMFMAPKKWKPDFTRKAQAFFCGGMVGFFQLTAGVGGPLLDIMFQNRKLPRHAIVASKAFTQAVAHLVKFIYFAAVAGLFTTSFDDIPLWLCVAIVPLAAAGSYAGKYLLQRLNENQFFIATQGLLAVIGAIYLFKAATLWAGS